MTDIFSDYAVEMRGISKRFGSLVANDHVDFALRRGEIHALLGENGAGKSTLMRILYGLYHADAGTIEVDGKPTAIHSPKAAIAHGIGMVSQHFALVAPLTVTENVILGRVESFRLQLEDAHRQVGAAAQRFGIEVDPRATIRSLSVGQRQRVEILKALCNDVRVLILDEPTAVLAPQEVEQLFANLRHLQEQGLSVVFISHKLHEVLSITDRVTVLRQGRVVATVDTVDASRTSLAEMMVGRKTLPVERSPGQPAAATTDARTDAIAQPASHAAAPGSAAAAMPVLELRAVSALDRQGLPALRDVSLRIAAAEIVGLAGVSGNGQVELAEVLSGTRRCSSGQVLLGAADITNGSPSTMMAAGIGRIPEDRHASVVGEMSVEQNLALEHLEEFVERGRLNRRRLRRHAETLIAEYQIKAQPQDKIRTLSGGNIQKCLLARVLERNPKLVVVAQPTRGLDVGATEYVHNKLLAQRQKGAAILLISEDLDEILALADRVAVIYEGRIAGELPASAATPERLGLLMSGGSQPSPAAQSAPTAS